MGVGVGVGVGVGWGVLGGVGVGGGGLAGSGRHGFRLPFAWLAILGGAVPVWLLQAVSRGGSQLTSPSQQADVRSLQTPLSPTADHRRTEAVVKAAGVHIVTFDVAVRGPCPYWALSCVMALAARSPHGRRRRLSWLKRVPMPSPALALSHALRRCAGEFVRHFSWSAVPQRRCAGRVREPPVTDRVLEPRGARCCRPSACRRPRSVSPRWQRLVRAGGNCVGAHPGQPKERPPVVRPRPSAHARLHGQVRSVGTPPLGPVAPRCLVLWACAVRK